MREKLKWAGASFAAAFALLQLGSPPRANPRIAHDMMTESPPPPEIARLLRAACGDCHSHETRWPWYSHVAPVSWLLTSDVNEARRHLNLSQWPQGRPERAVKWLNRMSEEIDSREMPPKNYMALHPASRLTNGERKELAGWLDGEAERQKALERK
jgi:hypothetical protein